MKEYEFKIINAQDIPKITRSRLSRFDGLFEKLDSCSNGNAIEITGVGACSSIQSRIRKNKLPYRARAVGGRIFLLKK